METIIYQGCRVQALLITEINVVRGEGFDALLRDAKGRYYFRRETYDEQPGGCREAKRNPVASNYRCRVRRISLRATILFQVAFAANRALRADAVRLMAGKTRTRTAPGRITVELDDLASAMLRQVCREGNGCREAGEDPRDLVNAAVTFYLCDDATSRQGGFDLEIGDAALQRAKRDRLELEGRAA